MWCGNGSETFSGGFGFGGEWLVECESTFHSGASGV